MASLWMLARLFQFDLDFPIIADPIIARENWLLTPEREQDFFFVFSQQYRRKLYLETYVFGSSSIWTCRI
jgi:hypothetical protein